MVSSDSRLFWIGRSSSGCDTVQTCVIPSVTNLTQVRVTSWSTSSLPVRLLLYNRPLFRDHEAGYSHRLIPDSVFSDFWNVFYRKLHKFIFDFANSDDTKKKITPNRSQTHTYLHIEKCSVLISFSDWLNCIAYHHYSTRE